MFKDYLTKEMNEATPQAIAKALNSRIEKLEDVKNLKIVESWVVKDYGSGYKKDFNKVRKHIDEAIGILQEIITEVEMGS